jgi:hypothetical protein
MDNNTGHGHVWPRPDGMRVRCGGPTACSKCAIDKANYDAGPARNKLTVDQLWNALRAFACSTHPWTDAKAVMMLRRQDVVEVIKGLYPEA